MRVLALDPGERVGWARADVAEDGTWTDLRHGITELRDMAVAVHEALIKGAADDHEWHREPDYDIVVVEDWRLYPGMAQQFVGSNFPAVRFIGAVQLCCWLSSAKIVMQGARIKEPTLKVMRKLDPDLHTKVTRSGSHDDLHDMDAIMHLYHWSWKNCPSMGVTKEAA